MTDISADTVELKPCPFCGNDGSGPVEDALQICDTYMEGQWKAPFAYSVQCDKCTATMGYSESEDAAVEAWNTRIALTVEDAAKVAEREARRQKSLVELAYSEGVLDASARSATVDNAGEKFATSDAKAASDDPLVHQLEWPDHYESSAIADTPKEGE